MNKILLCLMLVGAMLPAIGQTGTKQKVQTSLTGFDKPARNLQSAAPNKNITCIDTLYYPLIKETVVAAVDSFYTLPTAQNEMEAQAYLNPGTITISGVIFYATKATTNVTVEVSLYNVNAAFMPTTVIPGTTGTVNVTLTTAAEYAVNFTTPVSVTGNYAVVLKNTTNKTLNVWSNNAKATTYGEGLGYSYYDAGAGMAWSTHVDTWGQDLEILAHPIVSYPITTDFTASDYTVCPGTAVSFTTNVTPLSLIQHRMFTWDAFSRFWSITVPDSTYAWDMGDGSPILWANNHTYTFNTPGQDTVVLFTLGGLWNSCLDYAGYIFTIYNNPTVTATALPASVCLGGSTTITGGGASTFAWSTGSSNNSITVGPTTATTYTVTGTDVNTCTNTALVTVNVNPLPTIGISASATSVCQGAPATLTASGGVSYVWSTSATTNPITVNPTSTTTYTVTGTDGNGCTGTATITITVNPLPTVSAVAASPTICAGQSTNLTASGAAGYLWNTGVTTNPLTVSPTSTTTYSVTGASLQGCTSTASVTVTVNPAPSVTITASANPVCSGTSTNLTAGGAQSYTWSTGGSSNPLSVSPTTNTTYTVTGLASNGCSGSQSITVTVNAKPTLVPVASPNNLCLGQSTNLSVTGATSYVWDQGLGAGSSFVTSPTTNTTYAVTGTDGNNCTNTASVSVTVAPCSHPTAAITVSDNDICIGQSITYTDNSSGVNVDTWAWTFNGGSTTSSTLQGPHTITYNSVGTYTTILSVSDDNGTDDTTITITVHGLPTVGAGASVNPVCEGTPTSLTATGASTYIWNGGSTSNPYVVSPTSTTTYSVTGTDVNGCQNTASVAVTVNTAPVITLTATSTSICAGQSSTLTAGGGVSYVWNQSLSGTSNTVSPGTTTTYQITGTGSNGCQNTASVTIVVNPLPVVGASANPTTSCAGGAVVLTATGATNYLWNTMQYVNPITVNPTTTTTYSVTGATAAGCTATATVAVTVNPLPTISAAANPTVVCPGNSAVLTASGGNTYSWDGGNTTNPWTVTPASTTTYTVTGSSAAGCTASATVTVTVATQPVISVAANPAAVCAGSSSVLTASGASTYLWNGGTATNPYTVTPATTTVYSVTGTDTYGCSGTADVTVTVNTLPTVTVTLPTAIQTVCKDSLVTLSGGAPAGGTWSGTGVSGDQFSTGTIGSYTVTYSYTDGNGCSNSANGTITVENCTSISEYSGNVMSVFPNPSSDMITISFDQADAATAHVALFDLSGRMVSNEILTLDGAQVTLPVQQLPAGVYTLKVTMGSDVFFTKITRL